MAGGAAGADLGAALALLLAGGELAPDMAGRATNDPAATLRNAGALLNAAVAGLRALLIARGSVKREFRIEQTMLRRKENNPLKFSQSDEQALAALLDPRTNALGFLQESINDLTAHQVAVLAATQAAARALLEQLDPAKLVAADPGGGLLPGAQEKRLWEAYKRRHAQMQEQFEDDFESAFGTAFARAYEQAVERRNE
jgi:type VI secretion system protein ImpI/type VI secretion system protein